MGIESSSLSLLRTGTFVVDPLHYEVRSGETCVSLEPKVMSVLLYLLERPGEVVSKDELLREVWEGRHVSHDVVAAAVYQIRKAFSDRAAAPHYLETVHRRGYRWRASVGPVRRPTSARWRWVALAAALLAPFVASALLRHAGPAPSARVAYEKGRYFLDRRTPEALRKATEAFESAVALSPDWAPAHAGLADALMVRLDLGIASREEVAAEARGRAAHALELDPSSGEAWTSVGLARLLFDFDTEAADEALERARVLAPEASFTHQVHAWLLSSEGKLDRAVEAATRASFLAPTASSPYLDRAFILGLARRHEEAVASVELAIELDDSRPGPHAALGWALALAGHEPEALAAFGRFIELSGVGNRAEMTRRVAEEGLSGLYRYHLSTFGPRMRWTTRARMHAALGESGLALDCLERAFREGDTAVLWVEADPAFQSLKSDPRFLNLMTRL